MRFSAHAASVLLAACLASCAYVEATTTQYVGVPRFPPVEPAAVQVLPDGGSLS